MAGRSAGGAANSDVPPAAGAAGADSEVGWWGAAARDSHDTGPSGANRRPADLAADLRGRHGTDSLWLSTGADGAGGPPGGAPGAVRRAHCGDRRRRIAVFRCDPARGVDEVAGAPHQRSEAAPVAQDVVEGAGGGTSRGRRVAIQWGQAGDARDSPRRGCFAVALEPLHESVSESLSPSWARRAVRGATRKLRMTSWSCVGMGRRRCSRRVAGGSPRWV